MKTAVCVNSLYSLQKLAITNNLLLNLTTSIAAGKSCRVKHCVKMSNDRWGTTKKGNA